MNEYSIERKIYTYSEIFEHLNFQIHGYYFKNYDFSQQEGAFGDAWLIKKEIRANNFIDAINLFNKELKPILSRACFISQCGMQYDINPLFCFKKNDNPDRIFYFHFMEKRDESNLCFMQEEQQSLVKSMEYQDDAVFDFLSASNNSLTYHSRLASLIMALESIAGETKKIEYCTCGKERKYVTTNKDTIKEILNDNELYKKIYDHSEGIRNIIFHGKYFRPEDGTDYASIIYKKIIEYFNSKYGLKIDTNIVGAPRNGLGKYGESKFFVKPKYTKTTFNLKSLLEMYEEVQKYVYVNSDQKPKLDFEELFERLPNKDYIETY